MLVKSLESGNFLNIKVASFKNTNLDSLGVNIKFFILRSLWEMQVNDMYMNDALERASLQEDFGMDEGGGNDNDSAADDFLHG